MAQLDALSRRGRRAAAATQPQQAGSAISPTIAADSVMLSVQANIFVADPKFNLIYMNPKAAETLQRLANDIEQAFRVRLADVLGGSIHRFHKDPARVERILQSPQFRPHDAQFTFGAVTLDTHINRILGPDGVVTGYVVAWEDISEKLAAEERAHSLTRRLAETVDKTKDVSVALQSVSAAMEEMSATVLEIARHGSDTAGVVLAAVTVVEAATTTMNNLGQASTQINEVVNTISQIAKQTNLLALNATIEAARAGDAGKGFAVVAGEVKDLSAATQTATERIGGLIENVQDLSQAAAAAMMNIAEVVDKVRDGQTATAAAVEEQTATNQEITRSLSQAAQQAELVTADVAAFLDATTT